MWDEWFIIRLWYDCMSKEKCIGMKDIRILINCCKPITVFYIDDNVYIVLDQMNKKKKKKKKKKKGQPVF